MLEEEESWIISELSLEVSSERQTSKLHTTVASVTAWSCVPAGLDTMHCAHFDRHYKGSIDPIVGKTDNDTGYIHF